MIERRFRACNLCEATCGLAIEIEGERIVKITGDEADPFSRGYFCIKGEALADLHTDPNRLRMPVRRRGSQWDEIGWEEALDEVAQRFRAIQKAHGRDAVATYAGNPVVHNYGTMLTLRDTQRALGSRNRYSATSLDQLPHHVVARFLFGHQLLLPVPDVDRTQLLLILGGNPVVSRGSMMTAPDITERLKAIRARGGRVVLVDPRRTETAGIVDEHCFIRPGTDAALLLGMLHVTFAEGLARPGRLAALTDGIDTIAGLVKDVSLPAVATMTGIDAETVQRLARAFAAAESAVCYGRFGASTQEFGALTQWLLTVLNIVTGNLDRAGGAMFATPALDPLPRMSRGHFNRWQSRVRGLPEFSGELPVSVLAEEMATPGVGQVRGLLTVAGNPALSAPNGGKLEAALAGLDFMASVDLFINETSRFAHIILPPTGALEHEHYDIAFHVLGVRNTAKFSPAIFQPAAGARHDWQILRGLTERLAPASPWPLALARRLALDLATPERILDLGLRLGPHRLSLAKLRRAPHGIDLGPLQPRLPQRLFTPTRRIELAPAPLVQDLQRLRQRLSAPPSTSALDLLLIGRRQVRTNNSWMGHIPRLTKGKTMCTALIHTDDAARRGVKSGDLVRVSSRVGAVVLPAVVVDGIMPGVISIPHGFGHARTGVRLDFDQRALGVSVNELTDEAVVDALIGTAVLNGVPVKLERVAVNNAVTSRDP